MTQRPPPTRKELRNFAIALVIFAGGLGGLLLWRGNAIAGYVLLGIGGLAAAVSLVSLAALRPIHRVFLLVGRPIGVFNACLILSLIYLLIFTPVALLRRLFGKDPLRRRRDPQAASYWEERSRKTFGPDDIKHQY